MRFLALLFAPIVWAAPHPLAPLTAAEILAMMEETLRIKAEIIETEDPLLTNKRTDVFTTAKYIFETPENYHRDLIRKYYAS